MNRTKPNQKPIEPNRSIGSAIEHNRTGAFCEFGKVRLPNPIELNGRDWFDFIRFRAGCGHRQLPSEPDPFLLFSA